MATRVQNLERRKHRGGRGAERKDHKRVIEPGTPRDPQADRGRAREEAAVAQSEFAAHGNTRRTLRGRAGP